MTPSVTQSLGRIRKGRSDARPGPAPMFLSIRVIRDAISASRPKKG
jgi:hypothetical protein